MLESSVVDITVDIVVELIVSVGVVDRLVVAVEIILVERVDILDTNVDAVFVVDIWLAEIANVEGEENDVEALDVLDIDVLENVVELD